MWADLEEALALSRELRHLYREAKMLYALGTLRRQRRERDAGRRYLTEARDILARLGERTYGAQVEEALQGHVVHLQASRASKSRP